VFGRWIVAILALGWLAATPAAAGQRAPTTPIVVTIDVSSQRMTVRLDGWPYAYWKVSTAREGYHTPRGKFRVQRTARVYFSKKYDNAPMPNAVFFKGGYAIHGTYSVRQLGRPASHGCVRLDPDHAEELYELVQEYGPRAATVIVVD
jgi:lipoprotein-anchoring transpeptidase ErfK/SrfK